MPDREHDPPGSATPLHLHRNAEESFLILEGELDATVGGKMMTVRQGESVLLPRGTPHQIRNTSGREVRAIQVGTPAGFDDFVVAAAGLTAGEGAQPAPDPARIKEIAARFGIEILA